MATVQDSSMVTVDIMCSLKSQSIHTIILIWSSTVVNMIKNVIGGIIVVIIVVFMWSWASNIAPSFFLRTVDAETIECQDCPFDDLARCQTCVDIHEEYYNEAQD